MTLLTNLQSPFLLLILVHFALLHRLLHLFLRLAFLSCLVFIPSFIILSLRYRFYSDLSGQKSGRTIQAFSHDNKAKKLQKGYCTNLSLQKCCGVSTTMVGWSWFPDNFNTLLISSMIPVKTLTSMLFMAKTMLDFQWICHYRYSASDQHNIYCFHWRCWWSDFL